MKEKLKKPGYEAPKMEATSFVTEKGYAGSGAITEPLKDKEFIFS